MCYTRATDKAIILRSHDFLKRQDCALLYANGIKSGQKEDLAVLIPYYGTTMAVF